MLTRAPSCADSKVCRPSHSINSCQAALTHSSSQVAHARTSLYKQAPWISLTVHVTLLEWTSNSWIDVTSWHTVSQMISWKDDFRIESCCWLYFFIKSWVICSPASWTAEHIQRAHWLQGTLLSLYSSVEQRVIHVIQLCALSYILISCGHQDGISVSDTWTSIFSITFALNTTCWLLLASGLGTRWIWGAIHVKLLYLWFAASQKWCKSWFLYNQIKRPSNGK